jgi:hypothetical protein
MDLLDSHHLRSDIVNRLLGGNEDEAVSPFLDRLVEIAEMENGEHQMLVDPIDKNNRKYRLTKLWSFDQNGLVYSSCSNIYFDRTS